MKKIKIFVFNIDHAIDIITNSSSELFVLQGKTKEIVNEMILNQYPNYTDEYEELKNISELTTEELDTYISYKYYTYQRNNKHSLFDLDPSILWKNYNNKNEVKYWYPELTEEGAKLIKEKISPNNDLWFLFSIDENPNWDFQEKLETIATRYHLG